MPGSRKAEIQNNLEVMIDGFNQFNFEEKYKAIIPIYKEDDKYLIQDKIQKHKNITLANVESSEILKKAKAAVVCSGTATLEALLAEVPTTVIYKTNWFNHLVLKNLMMSEFVSIPNIIADEEIFLELLQSNATPENIAHDLNSNIADYEFRKEMIQAVKAKLEKTNLESFVTDFMKIAGVDEVGIGCLAGPLISAAVIFGKNKSEYFFKDSKKTTQKNRAVQASYIKSNFYVGLGVASPSEIDELNVLKASHLAMIRAIENLPVAPKKIIIDGIHTPKGLKNAEAMIKGDENHQEIAAASIVAKYFRDQLMLNMLKNMKDIFSKKIKATQQKTIKMP